MAAVPQTIGKMGLLRRRGLPYLLLSPSLALVAFIAAYPVGYLFYLSFQRTHYLEVRGFGGFDNYPQLWSESGLRSLVATLQFVGGSVVLTLLVAIILAVALEAPLRARSLLRTAIIAPWLVSQVVTSLIWQAALDPNFGPVSEFLKFAFGLYLSPLADQQLAMLALITANVWRSFPLALILLLAAVQSIPSDLYESARLDGATKFQEFRFVTLPPIRKTLIVVVIILTFETFGMVSLPMILTGGGPNEATYVLSLRVWRQAFAEYRFGFSAATGVFVFLVNLLLTIYYVRFFTRKGAANVS